MGTVFHERFPQGSCLGGEPPRQYCDECGYFFEGIECERCRARELRGGMAFSTVIFLLLGIGGLCGLILIIVHLFVGSPK